MPISTRFKQRPGAWRDVLAPEVLQQYVGKHIAIIHKEVIASGDSVEEVLRAADEKYPSEMPYLAYIAMAKLEGDDGESVERVSVGV